MTEHSPSPKRLIAQRRNTRASLSTVEVSLQNCSIAAWQRNEEPSSSFKKKENNKNCKKLLHQHLEKHSLRFPALIGLHKQLRRATSVCLKLVERRYALKELRIIFQLWIPPSSP